jgi:hypothetical protein
MSRDTCEPLTRTQAPVNCKDSFSRNSYTSHSGIPISDSLPNRHKFHEEVKSTPKKTRKQKSPAQTTINKKKTQHQTNISHHTSLPFLSRSLCFTTQLQKHCIFSSFRWTWKCEPFHLFLPHPHLPASCQWMQQSRIFPSMKCLH